MHRVHIRIVITLHHTTSPCNRPQRNAPHRSVPSHFQRINKIFLVIRGAAAAAAGRQGREGEGGSGGWVGALHKSRGGGREGGYVPQIRYYRVEELDKVRGKCE